MTLRALLLTSLALSFAAAAHAQDAPVPIDPAVSAIQTRALADDTAWQITSGLTTDVGERLDGSEAEGRARGWAVKELTALGFKNVHVEPFMLPAWTRGAESAAVVSPFPQPLRITGLGYSGPTPKGGLTLPVVFFASYDALRLAPMGSLKGKIAFVSNSMQPTQDGSGYGLNTRTRRDGPTQAALRGAAAILVRSIGTDHSRSPHAGVTDFAPGVAPIPAAALSVADAENLERMVHSGQTVVVHLELDDHAVGNRPSGNVVAEVPGTDPAAGVVLIGGHLDSWDLGTGAIDDATGIAITTAAAKLMMESGPHRRTIRVVWFGDEETGGFGGKAYFAAHKDEPHALAAESDLGADRVWRVQFALPDSAKPVAARLTAALEPLGVVAGTGKVFGGEDVGPMLERGVPGVDLNQSALRYFDWHHTAEDVLDRVDPEQLRQNVAAWATMLAVVADAPEGLK